MNKDELMVKINPKYQKKVFQFIINNYGSSLKAGSEINIPASSIRGYKNLYFNSIPKDLIDRLIEKKIIDKNELIKNTILIFNKEDLVKKSLDIGRKKRRDNINKLKAKIPKIESIIKKNKLDVETWLKAYLPLTYIFNRKVEITSKNNFLELRYMNYTHNGFKKFKVNIPKKINLDDEFLYFFGLWCGDRSGGKRFGIVNQNYKIINFTESFLKKYFQKTEKILYIKKGLKKPTLTYNKLFYLHTDKNGWALSIHSNNGFLSSFFHYLNLNLDEFLNSLPNKAQFFAGLFDAEGNVSLYNKSFRWACKNERLTNIYKTHLKSMKLYDVYDGNCLISYNKEEFYNKILPYMKHEKKINLIKFLYNGKGSLPEDHYNLLNYISKNPSKTAKGIAKGLKKTKVYSELNLLRDFEFITSEGYPFRFKINNKGLNSLGELKL